MTSPADLLFGKLVVMNHYATREQVEACISDQHALAIRGTAVPLGELMRRKNLLTSGQVDSLLMEQTYLEVRKEDIRFGELAIKNGLASEAQVSECLTLQEKRFRSNKDLFRVGEIMAERGFLSPQQVTALLKAQERLKAAAAAQRQREKEAAQQIPPEPSTQPSLRESYTAPPATGAIRRPKSEPAIPVAPAASPPQRRPSDPALRPVSPVPPQRRSSEPAIPTVPPVSPVPPQKRPSDPALRAIPAAPPYRRASEPAIPTVPPVSPTPPRKTPSEPRLQPVGAAPQTRHHDPWTDETTGSEQALNTQGLKASLRVVSFEGTGTAKHKQVTIVSVEGVLDAHTFPYFERYMNDLADAGNQYFVVNCAKLDYISSPGIGVLIGMAKRAKEMKGDLRVAELPAKIKQIFDLIGGGGLIRIFEIERGAIMSFKYI